MTLFPTGNRDSRGGVGDETDADMPEGWNLPGPLHLGRLHQVRYGYASHLLDYSNEEYKRCVVAPPLDPKSKVQVAS